MGDWDGFRIQGAPRQIRLIAQLLLGRHLAERLAAVRPGVKVPFLPGYTDDAVVGQGVLQAEYAFLQKPFTPTALP